MIDGSRDLCRRDGRGRRDRNRDTSRCNKGARLSRFKVVEVQGSSRFKVCRGSRFVEVQGSLRMRVWCGLPRCRPTERVRSSRCIHETQSESAEELQQASSSLLIAPSAPSSSVHPTSTLPRRGSPARVTEVCHVIDGSRDLCCRDGRGRRDTAGS